MFAAAAALAFIPLAEQRLSENTVATTGDSEPAWPARAAPCGTLTQDHEITWMKIGTAKLPLPGHGEEFEP